MQNKKVKKVTDISDTEAYWLEQGLLRWKQIKELVNVHRDTWRNKVVEGRAPPAIRGSSRCIWYKASEISKYLEDPLNYYAPGFEPKNQIPEVTKMPFSESYFDMIAKLTDRKTYRLNRNHFDLRLQDA